MKAFTSPLFLLGSLLALFGLGRFAYCVGQAALGQEGEIRAERVRQGHLAGAARALLRDGREAEAGALLDRAEKSGAIQFYRLRREDKLAAAAGDASPRALTTVVGSEVEAGPFSLAFGTRWSWPAKLAAAAREVGEEILFLALAGWALLLSGAGVRRLRRPRRGSTVRVLRALHPERAAARRAEAGPPPAEGQAFECALLRVQLDASREPVPAGARAEALDAAGRYGGELAGAGGPELVCFFRDRGDGHSALAALGAARDLRERLKPGARYALAHGFVRLVPDGAGERRLVGAPLLEAARLAAEPGRIVVTERVAKCAAPAVKFRARGGVICYAGHAALADALGRGAFAALDGFHSDPHLAEILRSLPGSETEYFLGVGRQLRGFCYRRCSAEAREAFKAALREELRRGEAYRLSSLVALAAQFFSPESVDEEARRLFLEALASPDHRVQANVVELFIQLYPGEEVAELRPCAGSADHRVSANALIKRALERFDERVVRALYGRVRGGSVAHVASALFAIGEIARHYRLRDPAFLRSRHSFLRLFEEIPFWARHPNPMVRRQALAAAGKLADPELDGKLRALFLDTHDPELLALFESIYRWRKGEKQAPARRTA